MRGNPLKLDLAISPCPNDTFIFHHLLRPNFLPGLEFEPFLEDVEELNRRAIEERRHQITKLSYYALAAVTNDYRILKSGGALGRGCGPLLLSSQPLGPNELPQRAAGHPRFLIPGRWTTANLLLRSYLQHAGLEPECFEFLPLRYDRIIKRLRDGEDHFGVIIHEERFTFEQAGLHAVVDLGDFWERETGLPIPLGGIAIRRDVDGGLTERIEGGIRESLRRARANPESTGDFVRRHAQSLDDDVIAAHIGLYVNDFSLDLGEEGRRAVERLFSVARATDPRVARTNRDPQGGDPDYFFDCPEPTG